MADTVLQCDAILVDTQAKVKSLLELLHSQAKRQLFLDFEGIQLSRAGRLCIGQLTYPGSPSVWLLDFVALPNVLEVKHQGRSLRQLFESEDWTKFFWDPRNDVDALYAQCDQVLPRNVICLQLCDVARDRMRGQYRPRLSGLAKVLGMCLPDDVAAAACGIKATGKLMFAPECGGSYSVFEARPLAQEIVDYCVVDVAFFSLLVEKLWEPLGKKQRRWVISRSARSVQCCLDPTYLPFGKHKSLVPK